MQNLDEVGAVIGRFQIDSLHEGHRALLDFVTTKHKRVVVLVGVRPINPDSKNPLSFEVRKNMIQELYPGVLILPIEDCKHDEVWSHNVDKLLRIAIGEYPVHFYTGRDGFKKHYHGRHIVEEVRLTPEESATDRRNEIRTAMADLSSSDFRAGIIHGVLNRYPTVETTVDMAIINNGRNGVEICLGKKEGESEWRLPGGFVDGPERLEVSATRETAEETGLSIDPSAWTYVACDVVDDWRVHGTPDHFIRTFLFVAHDAHFGALSPGDDLADVKWCELKYIERGDTPIVQEHRRLIAMIIDAHNSTPMAQLERKDEDEA